MKLFYLCFFMATGAYSPYLGLYLQAVHLDGVQIGVVASVVPLVAVGLQPLWGALSDRYGWRKRMLNLALLGAAVMAPLVALAHSFVALLPLFILLAVALSPVTPLSDATTLEWLRRHGGSYGSVRVYGSLGYLLLSLASGSLYGDGRILWLFPLYGALLCLTFVVSLAAPRQEDMPTRVHGEGLGAVLGDRVVLVFLALAVLGYGTYTAYNTFFALYLKSLGAGTGVVGISAAVATASELPVMILAGPIMSRLGVKPLLLAGLGAAATRWVAYALVHDYRVAVAFGLLHGLSFAGFYVAGITFIDQRVPARLRATGQTLFNGATFGLGSVAGANLFGFLFDRLHPHGMFAVAALLCIASIIGLAVLMPNVVPARRPAPSPSAAKQAIVPGRIKQD